MRREQGAGGRVATEGAKRVKVAMMNKQGEGGAGGARWRPLITRGPLR